VICDIPTLPPKNWNGRCYACCEEEEAWSMKNVTRIENQQDRKRLQPPLYITPYISFLLPIHMYI
jgi:hypothetical protein